MRIEMKKPSGLKLKTADKICDEDIIVVPVLHRKEITVTGDTTVTSDVGFVGLSEVVINVKAPECDHTECDHTDLTCELDFSDAENGDSVDEMVITAPANTAYNVVHIYKPDALKPEYIREGLKIAGIMGTLKTKIENVLGHSYAEGVGF